jgi:hypothetical protein
MPEFAERSESLFITYQRDPLRKARNIENFRKKFWANLTTATAIKTRKIYDKEMDGYSSIGCFPLSLHQRFYDPKDIKPGEKRPVVVCPWSQRYPKIGRGSRPIIMRLNLRTKVYRFCTPKSYRWKTGTDGSTGRSTIKKHFLIIILA